MIKSLKNQIRLELETILEGITIYPQYPQTTPEFPCITLREISNVDDMDTRDSSGTKHVDTTIQIDIFTTGNSRENDALEIAYDIDDLLGGTYRLPKIMAEPIDNYVDINVYRYVLRYSYKISRNNTIYRG
jgi:hypothetical protein